MHVYTAGSACIPAGWLQDLEPEAAAKPSPASRWVLGWQFAAGEYLQMSRDVFGDEGIQQVFMSPSLQGGPDGSSDSQASGRGLPAQTPQRVAVFSKCSCCWHLHPSGDLC